MTKEITCTNGMKVLVDDEFYPLLAQHNWYINYSGKRPYAITKLKTDQSKIWRCIFMHHLILGTSTSVDHIDNNPLNNQLANLRKATIFENNVAKPKAGHKNGKPTTSKYKGVHLSAGKWRAGIGFNRQTFWLGTFVSEDDAARAYNARARELLGPTAWLNPIPKVTDIEDQKGE